MGWEVVKDGEQWNLSSGYIENQRAHNCVSRVLNQILDTVVFHKFWKSKDDLSSIGCKICHFWEMRMVDFNSSPLFLSKRGRCGVILTILGEGSCMSIKNLRESVFSLLVLFILLRHNFKL